MANWEKKIFQCWHGNHERCTEMDAYRVCLRCFLIYILKKQQKHTVSTLPGEGAIHLHSGNMQTPSGEPTSRPLNPCISLLPPSPSLPPATRSVDVGVSYGLQLRAGNLALSTIVTWKIHVPIFHTHWYSTGSYKTEAAGKTFACWYFSCRFTPSASNNSIPFMLKYHWHLVSNCANSQEADARSRCLWGRYDAGARNWCHTHATGYTPSSGSSLVRLRSISTRPTGHLNSYFPKAINLLNNLA